MTARDEILVTSEPKSPRWELPASATGQLTMIGWRLAEGHSIDGGVPPAVAALLLRGLTRSFWVSYFDAVEPSLAPPDRVDRLVVSGLRARMRAAAQRLPGTVFQISTRRPEVAGGAFDASLFSWSMRGQILLLSAPQHGPRPLSWAEMWSLTERAAPVTVDALTALAVDAVVFPGVDGDVAAVVSSTSEVEAKILAELRKEAETAGFGWRVLSEDEFARAT